MLSSEYDHMMNKVIDDVMVQFPLVARKVMMATKWKNAPISSGIQLRLLDGLIASPMTPSEISYLHCISRPNVTTLISKLIEGGFAERSHDENDMRVIYITITEKGKKVVLRHHRLVKRYLLKVIDKFSEDEMRDMFAAMDKLRNLFVKMNNVM
jgi:DNA-binding MarR family transcriptional regulator